MAVVPTYESKVTLQANNGGGANTPLDVSKMFPATKPDFSKVGVALMKAQDKMDKARVLEYKNAMLQYVSDQTYGDNGYLKQLGKNALAQDEQGNGLTQRGLAGYDKFSDEWFRNNNLTPRQMKLAREEGLGVRLQYQNGMGSHVLQEGKRYQLEQCETATSNAINAGVQATNPEDIGIAFGQLKQSVTAADDILGRDSEAATAAMKTATSKFWQSVFVKNLLTTDKDPIGGFRRAKSIYDAHYKDMDAATMLDCQAKLRAAEENHYMALALADFKTLGDIASIPGASTLSQVVTNGTKNPTGVLYQELTRDNTQSWDGKNVAKYANGGYGISGLRTEDMLKTVKANKSLNVEGLSDKELTNKFLTNRAFNYEVGMARADMLAKQYGDDAKVLVAYQLGEEKVDEAVNLASQAGKPDQWLDYVKGDTSNARKVLTRIREAQEGVVRGSDGKILDPCSADYIEKLNPLPTDEQLNKYLDVKVGDYLKKNPLAREQFLATLRSQSVIGLNDKKKQYQQNFFACIKAVQNGQELPTEALNSLPISAQRRVQDFRNKRNMGDGTPDYNAYAKYKLNPGLLARMSEEQYQTFVLPLMGNKADEITLLRNTERVSLGLAVDQQYASNVAASNAQVNWAFAPAADDLKGAVARVFFGGKMENSPRFNGMYWRLQTAVTYEAQRRARYSSTGKEIPLKGAELEHFMLKFKGDMDATGIVPIRMALTELPDKTEKDAYSLTQMLADRMMAKISGRNVPGTKDQQEMCWGAVCSGELPDGVNITIDELKSDFRISQSVLNEAQKQLEGEGKSVTSRNLLNRYALILCGWTPTGRGRPYYGPDAIQTTYTMADFQGGGD